MAWVILAGPHRLRSGLLDEPDGLWDSGLLAEGDSFAVQFNLAGTYPYYDSRSRDGLTGSITVLP